MKSSSMGSGSEGTPWKSLMSIGGPGIARVLKALDENTGVEQTEDSLVARI